jgi:hypothetical protein
VDPFRVNAIEGFSPEALRTVIEVIERSLTPEQFVYREAELDELWRQIRTAIMFGDGGADRRRLETLLELTMQAHEFVAHRDALGAARTLREAAALT